MDFCYPGVCANCHASCNGGSPLCGPCLEKLDRLAAAPCCDACARPLAYERASCPYCGGRGIGTIKQIARLGLFADPLRLLIHQIKYHDRWPLAEQLADRLLEQERVRRLLGQTDVLVPVPLHRLRQISRGYNQADVIASRLASQCGLKVAHPVVRLKQTRTQTHQHSRLARERNLRDAFGLVRPKTVGGLRIAIVDDVMTSAATLRSVARALRPAHPASLAAVVLAVADPRGRGFETI